MKVLFISNDSNMFDAGSPVRARLRAYAARIGELHVLSRAQGKAPIQEGALFLYPINAGGFSSFFPMLKRARALVREKEIDVVSAQDPFEHGYLALRAVQGTNVKLHIQIHTDFLSPFFEKESLKNRVRLFIANKVLVKAHGIRVVSKRIEKSLVAHYGPLLVAASVIPLAFESEPIAKVALPQHAFSFTLIAVGRLEREKRVSDILKALALVRRRYPKTGLFITGDGREKAALMKEVSNLGLSGSVIFLGWRTDVIGLIGAATAFIQASAYEGYGVSLIEAALAETPIISTDVGMVGEVLIPEKDLIVTPPTDVAALATGIIRLIEDNQLRRTLSLSAHEAAKREVASLGDISQRIADDLAHTGKTGNPA